MILLLLAGMAAAASAQPSALPEFSGQRAMELIVQQCDLGPRTPGSEGNLHLREAIVAAAEEAGLPVQLVCFEDERQQGDGLVTLCNIVVSAGPPAGPRLWLGAHYDTRPVSDMDPDPARRSEPLVGANDGASGVAVLWHLIELLGRQSPPSGVDLIFFDGEDSGVSGDPYSFCRGSAHLARTWQDFGSPLAGGEPTGLIVLDMIGKAGLQVPMEQYSLNWARDWTEEVFARAGQIGLDVLIAKPGRAVFDDHVPFLQAGIPAVDLIDFDYPQWHTVDDTPEHCSAASLAGIGRLVVDLVYRR